MRTVAPAQRKARRRRRQRNARRLRRTMARDVAVFGRIVAGERG